MPVAQFPGDRNWGYDGVYPYAVQNSYGGPRALQRLVDAAHQAGLAVILDVVYNHLGPEGNYLGQLRPLFHRSLPHAVGNGRQLTTGRTAMPVRQFVIDNACMWVRDFHVDGLRLDAVHAIYDFGPRHILAEIQAAVQQEAARAGRLVHVIAESNQNDVRLIRPRRARRLRAGRRLERRFSPQRSRAVDRRARRLLPGFRRAGAYRQGVQRRVRVRRLLQPLSPPPPRQPRGRDRPHAVRRLRPEPRSGGQSCARRSLEHDRCARRATAGVRPAVALAVRAAAVHGRGIRRDSGPFPSSARSAIPASSRRCGAADARNSPPWQFRWGSEIPDPQDPETFAAAKLAWAWPEGSSHAQLRQLYQDLLAARRRWPALRDRRHTHARLLNDSGDGRDGQPALLVLQRGGDDGLLAVANLTAQSVVDGRVGT